MNYCQKNALAREREYMEILSEKDHKLNTNYICRSYEDIINLSCAFYSRVTKTA